MFDADACNTCENGYVLWIGECYACSYIQNCLNCAYNAQNPVTSYECHQCADGYALVDDVTTTTDQCVIDCPPNCDVCGSPTSCTTCSDLFTNFFGYCYADNLKTYCSVNDCAQ